MNLEQRDQRFAPLGAMLLCALWLSPAEADPGLRPLFEGKESPAATVERWKTEGCTPAEALARVSLPLEATDAKNHRTRLRDAFGRSTELLVHVTDDGPGPDGYGVMIALHGLGWNAEQIVGPAKALLPPHTLLLSPSAQRPPDELEFEDMRDARDDLRQMVQERFPHWWSYRDRSFPILALDYVKARYPVNTDRVVLFGYSMGAFGAWNLGLRFHDRFAGLILMAGGLSRQEYLLGPDTRTRSLLHNARTLPSFIAHHMGDDVVPIWFARQTAQDLKRFGVTNYEFVELRKRGHGVSLNERQLGRLVKWVAERKRDPHPTTVEHYAIADYHGSAYWIRVDELSADRGRVSALVKERDRIDVETTGVARLTVYLDPTLVETSASVTIKVNGRQLHSGVVAPSLAAVAESFASARDGKLVYQHRVQLDLRSGND